jgi:hypothetical protein
MSFLGCLITALQVCTRKMASEWDGVLFMDLQWITQTAVAMLFVLS